MNLKSNEKHILLKWEKTLNKDSINGNESTVWEDHARDLHVLEFETRFFDKQLNFT